MVEQRQTTPHNNDDRTGAPSVLRFPHMAYNMAAVAYHLGDITNMLDSWTNERLHEAR